MTEILPNAFLLIKFPKKKLLVPYKIGEFISEKMAKLYGKPLIESNKMA